MQKLLFNMRWTLDWPWALRVQDRDGQTSKNQGSPAGKHSWVVIGLMVCVESREHSFSQVCMLSIRGRCVPKRVLMRSYLKVYVGERKTTNVTEFARNMSSIADCLHLHSHQVFYLCHILGLCNFGGTMVFIIFLLFFGTLLSCNVVSWHSLWVVWQWSG